MLLDIKIARRSTIVTRFLCGMAVGQFLGPFLIRLVGHALFSGRIFMPRLLEILRISFGLGSPLRLLDDDPIHLETEASQRPDYSFRIRA